MNAPRVHDLIRVDPAIAARWPAAPPWVAASLQRAPWVVVRRGLGHTDPDFDPSPNRQSNRHPEPDANQPLKLRATPDSNLNAYARADTDGDGDGDLHPSLNPNASADVESVASASIVMPVGIRGAMRAARFGAAIDSTDVCEVLRPEQLVARAGAADHRLAHAMRTLDNAARALDVRFGPTGAYGFELATGVAVTHAASDLDIAIVDAPPRATLAAFAACCTRIERATGVRIDADVLYADTGIALAELVGGAVMVLAKTPAGPRLVRAPA